MYNTSVVCTYNTLGVFLETDDITDQEKDFVRDILYRQELLDILGIEDYKEEDINASITKLYERLKGSDELRECMIKMARRFMSIEEEIGLMVLFAYDYMYLTHICVSEYLESGKISEANMLNLTEIIT
ncbi:MAG: hypothetical protein MUP82_11115 [Candidatus Marinimicrobia bacterium]|nr:hypothetical protein [Candidatus Neomarinimicrobiota bacterium]